MQPRVSDLLQRYASAVKIGVARKLLFFAASLAVSFWFLSPLLFGEQLPVWVAWVVFPPVAAHVGISLPAHFRAILGDDALRSAFFNPFLSTRLALGALRPTAQERQAYPWLITVYDVSLFLPLCSLALLLLSTVT